MNRIRNLLRRPLAVASAVAILLGSAAPALLATSAHAAIEQTPARSISMSDSTPGATNVVYALTLTLPNPAKSFVLDFCGESPIIGGDCQITTPTNTSTTIDASGATYSSTAPANMTPGQLPTSTGTPGSAATGWSLGSASAATIKMTSTTATTANGTYTFYFSGIKNPTTTGSFYARFYAYGDATYGSTFTDADIPVAHAYTPAAVPGSSPSQNPGTYVDYGGFALSTATNVNITAVVMETINFCVSQAAPSPSCAGVTSPTLTLGHGTPLALDAGAVDTATAYTQLSTNALNGAVISLKTTNSTTCAGLQRDGTCTSSSGIPPIGGYGAMTAGTAAFGLSVDDSVAAAGLTASPGSTVHAVSTTNNLFPDVYGTTTANPGSYAMNTTGANTGVLSTYGDPIAYATAACKSMNNLLTYAATASPTTPAGVYSTTEALIATGTF